MPRAPNVLGPALKTSSADVGISGIRDSMLAFAFHKEVLENARRLRRAPDQL